MRSWITFAALIAVIVLLVACASDRSSGSSSKDALSAAEVAQARGQEFSKAVVRASASGWSAGEVEELVALYTVDAILFPPKGERMRGRDAIRTYWSRTPDRRILEHSIQTERADLSGDLLAEHGKFTLTSQNGDSPAQGGMANFISIYKRGHDGVWRKHLDSWW